MYTIDVGISLLPQGHLGDCWFLSAVAVLTEASRISDVMITPEFNEEGIYTVRFCIQVFDSCIALFFVYPDCYAMRKLERPQVIDS